MRPRKKTETEPDKDQSYKAVLHKDDRYFTVIVDGKEWWVRPSTKGVYWFALDPDDEKVSGEGYTVFDAIRNATQATHPSIGKRS